MLLQTRIILFVLATLTVVVGLLIGFASLREDAADERLRTLELARFDTAWQLAVAGAAGRIEQNLGRLAGDPEILRALAAEDRGALAARVAALRLTGSGDGVDDVNLIGANGDVLHSSDPALDPPPLLNRTALDPILTARRLVRGVRLIDGQRLLVVAGAPLYSGGGVVGAAVAGVGFPAALEVLRQSGGGVRVFAVARDGAAIDGTTDPLWPAVAPLVHPADRGIVDLTAAGRRYALTSLPVADLAGGRVATVLIASDVTQQLEEHALMSVAYVAAVALLLLLALGLLYAYLRRNFAILDSAVGALQDLARGRAMGYVELPAGNDEIGRIAGAVDVFRGVMRDIERSAGQRERRLRRQQRFIRRQMEALAVTLEEEARQSLLDELRQIEAETHDFALLPIQGRR